MCRSKHVEQLRNTGIINSTARLHLVGSFYKICITMQGSMNIKFEVKDYLLYERANHIICADGVLCEFERSVGTFCLYCGHQILSTSFNMDHVTDLIISIVIGNDMTDAGTAVQ